MDCSRIPEIQYSDWRSAFCERVLAKRIPLAGSLELTFRCNNNCIHCYCNKPAHDRWEMSREMDTGVITRIINEITDEGCLWLLLTGGEPFLRPDFKEIYRHAKNKGMLVTIFTNGTLIDAETADFLADFKPFSVEITVYGATEKTYESVTMTRGSYGRCMKGIDLLLERKISLQLKTMALKQNIHEIPLLKKYAEDMDLDFRFDSMINSRLDMDKGPLSARLTVEDVVRLDREDAERFEEWKKCCNSNRDNPASDMLYPCHAGLDSFHVDPYGNLCPCVMARNDVYDLRAGTFREGWSVFLRRLKERKLSADNRCRHCKLLPLCGQCSGWSQAENGDDESPVDYLCEVAHKRAQVLGLIEQQVNERRAYEKAISEAGD